MSKKPRRIQRKRIKGWRMPPNTVYVGRGSRWGNRYKTGDKLPNGEILTRERVIELYRKGVNEVAINGSEYLRKYFDLSELRGKNLCCWCKPDELCHADILLELANIR